MPQISLFGWEFKRKDPKKEQLPSFTPQETNDGAVLISAGSGYGTYVDLDGTVRTEAELVTKYREMSLHPECDAATDEIVNESIAIEEKNIISINLEDVKVISDKLATAIKEEFQNCLKLLDFNSHSYDIYRRWYIDGRLYFHVIIDKDHPQEGIKELRYIDPRKIRKIREISKHRVDSRNPGDAVVSQTVNEYYIFNDKGFNYGNKVVGPSTSGLKIAKDTILHVVSGLTDNQGTMVLSYLHKAIKALNQLRTLEDALVIYRLCLVGSTRIKTSCGWKYLKDIKENDEVYSFTLNGLQTSKVKKSWCTGKKKTYEVKSKHFSIKGNDTHPILVFNKDTNIVEYVDIKNIFPDKHQFVYEKPFDSDIQVEILDKRKSVVKLLNPEIWSSKNIPEKEKYIEKIAYKLFLKTSTVRNFLYGLQYCLEEDAHKILHEVDLESIVLLDIKREKYNQNEINLPRFIDEDFAKLFGFLIGDGSIDKHRIVFAEGVDEEQNKYYASLLEKYFSKCTRTNSSRKYNNWICSNTLGSELLKSLGFEGKAKTKRFPKWIWNTSDSIKKSFIKGLCDADGHNSFSKTGKFQSEIELSNKELIEDIKELWTDIGLSSGHIRHRTRVSETRKFGNDFRTIPETESWTIFISELSLSKFEKIMTVTECEDEDVYDIEVEHEKHNFIGNGIVVHNSRAPERRIWYIDVGNLPKIKAEQYLRDIMVRHRNRLIYDAQSGEVKDDRKFMTMLEDYWLPRREGGRGTEVVTLPGGQTLGQMDDVLYFQKKFLNALNVPISRLNSDALDMGGTATGITRDELKFQKFVVRLRIKFTCLFTELLKKQLVLKGIMSLEEWDQISSDVKFDYAHDNYFNELKKAEIEQNRINLATAFQPMAGKYFPHRWIRKEVLQQTDDDIKEFDKEIKEEISSSDPRWINPEILQNESMGDQLYNQKLTDMHAQAMGQIPGQMGEGQNQEQGAANGQSQSPQGQSEQPGQNVEEPLKQAIEFIKSMKEKGKANRSMQDEAKYKQAVQLVSQSKANPSRE